MLLNVRAHIRNEQLAQSKVDDSDRSSTSSRVGALTMGKVLCVVQELSSVVTLSCNGEMIDFTSHVPY